MRPVLHPPHRTYPHLLQRRMVNFAAVVLTHPKIPPQAHTDVQLLTILLVLLVNLGLAVCIAVAASASVTVGRHWAAGWNLVSEFAAAAAIAGMRDHAAGLGRMLTLRPVVWVGERSYAIYLWHLPLITFVLDRGYGKKGIFAAWALTALAAAVSWRLVEQPFLRLKERFEPTSQARPARH